MLWNMEPSLNERQNNDFFIKHCITFLVFWKKLRIYRHEHFRFWVLWGLFLALLALLSGIALLALSGWFLSATWLAGLSLAAAQCFNFFSPSAGVRAFSIARIVSRYYERVVNHDVTLRVLAILRIESYRKISLLSPINLHGYRRGDLLNRFVKDINTLDHAYLGLVVPFFCAIVGVLSILLFIFLVAPWMVIPMAAVLSASIFFPSMIGGILSYKMGTLIHKIGKCMQIFVLDYVAGYAELCIHGAAEKYRKKIVSEEHRLYRIESYLVHIAGVSFGILAILEGGALVSIIWLASHAAFQQTLTAPVAVVLILVILAVFEAIRPLLVSVQWLGQIRQSVQRIIDIFQQKRMISFPKDDLYANNVLPHNMAFHFIDVSYHYPNQMMNVICKLNFSLEPGKKIAIIGPTGCGKSTLLKLLTREDDPQFGTIMLDDRSIAEYRESTLRRCMAVMPQKTHIFSATLRANLSIANSTATDAMMCSILRALSFQWTDDDKKFLDMWVGEGGCQLSGGEISRIGIARVLLQQKPVVLLDEPTEGLDAITETSVLNQLVAFCKGRTMLVVTHKPAILPYMDQIIAWQALQP